MPWERAGSEAALAEDPAYRLVVSLHLLSGVKQLLGLLIFSVVMRTSPQARVSHKLRQVLFNKMNHSRCKLSTDLHHSC